MSNEERQNPLAGVTNPTDRALIDELIRTEGLDYLWELFCDLADRLEKGYLHEGVGLTTALLVALRRMTKDDLAEFGPDDRLTVETRPKLSTAEQMALYEKDQQRWAARTHEDWLIAMLEHAKTSRQMLLLLTEDDEEQTGDHTETIGTLLEEIRTSQPISPYRLLGGQLVHYCIACYAREGEGTFQPKLEASSGARCRSCHLTALEIVVRDGVEGYLPPEGARE